MPDISPVSLAQHKTLGINESSEQNENESKVNIMQCVHITLAHLNYSLLLLVIYLALKTEF